VVHSPSGLRAPPHTPQDWAVTSTVVLPFVATREHLDARWGVRTLRSDAISSEYGGGCYLSHATWKSAGLEPGPILQTYLYGGKDSTLRIKTTRAAPLGATMEKKVHLRIDPNDESITLKDIMQKIQEIQRQHPDLDVFFDGDEYAVCSRPREKVRPIAEAVEGKKKA